MTVHQPFRLPVEAADEGEHVPYAAESVPAVGRSPEPEVLDPFDLLAFDRVGDFRLNRSYMRLRCGNDADAVSQPAPLARQVERPILHAVSHGARVVIDIEDVHAAFAISATTRS